MEKSEAKAWVDENLKRLMREYGIPHWRVNIEFIARDNETKSGDIETLAEYERADIRINYPTFIDAADLEATVRHELSHIIHSPFDILRDALEQTLTNTAFDTLLQVFKSCCEMTVRNIERMHTGHKEAYQPQETEK